jgi:hypothetical protein
MASPEPAAARIQWQGSFAISQYGPIATPYCEEEQIAIVARSYGWKVSGAEIQTIHSGRSMSAKSSAAMSG